MEKVLSKMTDNRLKKKSFLRPRCKIAVKNSQNTNLRVISATNTFCQILISSFGNLYGSEAKYVHMKETQYAYVRIMCHNDLDDKLSWLFTKGTSINDVRRFSEIFDLPNLPFSPQKRPISGVILNPPTYPKIGRH